MADNLPDEIERLVLDWLLTDATVERPVLPLMLRLTSDAPTDAAAGTEVTGDSYAPQQVTFAAAATASGVSKSTPSADVTFTMLDSVAAKSVAGAEIWDSGTVPRRILHGAFASAINVPAAQTFTMNASDLAFTLG